MVPFGAGPAHYQIPGGFGVLPHVPALPVAHAACGLRIPPRVPALVPALVAAPPAVASRKLRLHLPKLPMGKNHPLTSRRMTMMKILIVQIARQFG